MELLLKYYLSSILFFCSVYMSKAQTIEQQNIWLSEDEESILITIQHEENDSVEVFYWSEDISKVYRGVFMEHDGVLTSYQTKRISQFILQRDSIIGSNNENVQ